MGKKVGQWEKVRKELKNDFESRGVTFCELGYEGCWRYDALSFAHLDKRRYLTEEQLYEVVLACTICHNKVEYLPKGEMRKILQKVIDKRND